MRRLPVFENRCFRSTTRAQEGNCISNAEVRRRILNCSTQSAEKVVDSIRLRSQEMLRMSAD